MAKIEITVNGASYPCRPTLGAMLRFKRETGRDVTEITMSLSDLVVYLWCCVTSACKADGIAFDMPLMDFADSLSGDDVTEWAEMLKAEAASGADEKKSR